MKKKRLLQCLCLAFFAVFAFTGCATVSNISNPTPNEPIFNGGQAVQVGDYLYFANGYTAVGSQTTDFAYDANAGLSYLNRINLNGDMTLPMAPRTYNEKVNSKVAGYENQYMFVLGDFIYYTCPSTHKTNGLQNTYNLVSFFRCRLNGDGEQEIFTTNSFDSSKSQFRVLKGSDNNYYLVVFDGSELSSMRIGDNLGSRNVLASGVQSIAMPGEKDSYNFKQILYTVNKEGSSSEVEVYSVDYATTQKTPADAAQGLKFISRAGDVVFYSTSAPQGKYDVYYKTLTGSNIIFSGTQEVFYSTTAGITNVHVVASGDPLYEGYIFIGGNGTDGSNSIMYKNTRTNETPRKLVAKDDYSNLLFVDGDTLYYSTSTGISKVCVRDGKVESVVTVTDMIADKYAFANDYIYFYAKVQKDENDENEYEDDSNYYAYRVHKSGIGGYKILSNYSRTVK